MFSFRHMPNRNHSSTKTQYDFQNEKRNSTCDYFSFLIVLPNPHYKVDLNDDKKREQIPSIVNIKTISSFETRGIERYSPLIPHTVPPLFNTVPYRLALLIFFQYRTVPRRYGTVRYGIYIAYRQSLVWMCVTF